MLSARTHNVRSASYWRHAVRDVACSLMVMLPFAGAAAKADEQSLAPLIVDSLRGDVRATAHGAALMLKPGAVIPLPASLSVGENSALELHQGRTTISAAANSQLDIPLAKGTTDTLERVIQSKGNVFYSVAKRQGQKLRVETPYLVAVIKGTQFNVAAEDLATTIALFEGRLEVHAADDSDIVDLQAGHIAIRSNVAPVIRVVNMDTGETLRAGVAPHNAPVVSGSDGSASLVATNNDAHSATLESTHASSNTIALTSGTGSLGAADDRGVSSTLALNNLVAHASSPAAQTSEGSIATGTDINISTSGTSGTGITGGSAGSIGTGSNSGVGTGSSTGSGANAGAADGGGTSITTGTGTGASAGSGSGVIVNTGTSANSSSGASVNTGASTGSGTGVNVDTGASVVTGSGTTVNTGTSASAGTSGVSSGVTTETGDDKSNNGNGKSAAGSSSSGQNSGNSSKGSNGNSSLADTLKSLTKKAKK